MQSGASVRLKPEDALWFEQELEILYLDAGTKPPVDRLLGRDFLLGAPISWYELGLHYDVDRDQAVRLHRQVESELKGKKSVRLMNLYHAPGAGGSTVAKRLMWDCHRTYPCVLLRRSDPQATAERLYRLAALTGQSVFVMLDGSQITERQADELFDQIRARQIPAVLLQVLRRFHEQTEQRRTFYLQSTLTPNEAQRFVEVFAREQPTRRQRLESLKNSGLARLRTAFYFGLETFGTDFKGLEPYVGTLTRDLTVDQMRILAFIAIAHHYYAQRAINREAFTSVVGIRGRDLLLEQVFPHTARELLIEDGQGGWRTLMI